MGCMVPGAAWGDCRRWLISVCLWLLVVWFLVAVMRGFVLFPQRGVLLVFTCDWGCVGVVDKCWRMSLRSLLVRATIWCFRPSPPFFCLRVAEKRICGDTAHVLCSLLGGAWAQEAAARMLVVCGGGVL